MGQTSWQKSTNYFKTISRWVNNNMKLINIIILIVIISSGTMLFTKCQPLEFDREPALEEEKKDSIEIEIIIKKNEDISIELVMIPPDSGYWIGNGDDTIHIDSLNQYMEKWNNTEYKE